MRHMPKVLITVAAAILLGGGMAALTGQLDFALWFFGVALASAAGWLVLSPEGLMWLYSIWSEPTPTPEQVAQEDISWGKAMLIVIPAALVLGALGMVAVRALGAL